MTQPTLKELFDWIEAGPHNNPTHFELSRRKHLIKQWLYARTYSYLEDCHYQQLLDLAQLELCLACGYWSMSPKYKWSPQS